VRSELHDIRDFTTSLNHTQVAAAAGPNANTNEIAEDLEAVFHMRFGRVVLL